MCLRYFVDAVILLYASRSFYDARVRGLSARFFFSFVHFYRGFEHVCRFDNALVFNWGLSVFFFD